MSGVREQLFEIEQDIRSLEEDHNSVLDVSEETNKKISSLADELYAEADRIHQETQQIREEIRLRIQHAKKATVILSLLGQQEELAPVKKRIDTQPYEQYVRSDYFKKRLSELHEDTQ